MTHKNKKDKNSLHTKSTNSTKKKDLYLEVLNEFKINSNLTRIQNKLNLKKNSLGYYLKVLVDSGHLKHCGRGWYELTNISTDSTKYTSSHPKDSIRGHAYVWKIHLTKIPNAWNNRIEVLKKHKIDFKLVGALKSTPSIKIEGRKIWLCNDNIRIFDKVKASYYGKNAKESKLKGQQQAFLILRTLENKLGIKLSNDKLLFQKEHYAIIKNDLAKHYNKEKIKLSIKDETGEWLLVDDSMSDGGELENVGKSAYETNPKLQNWWNDNKKHNFEVNASFVLENINSLVTNQSSTQQNIDEVLLMMKAQLQINQTLQQEIIKLKDSESGFKSHLP